MTMKTRATQLLLVAGAIVAFGAGLAYTAISASTSVSNRGDELSGIEAAAGNTSEATPISSLPLTPAQCALTRGSRSLLVDTLTVLPQAASDAGVRRALDVLLGASAGGASLARLEGTEIAPLPGVLQQLAAKWAKQRLFDSALAQTAETHFNRANAICGWRLPDFDTGDPALPPGGGGGIEI